MLKSLGFVPPLVFIDLFFSYMLANKTHAMVAVLSMDHHATLNTLDWLYDTPCATKKVKYKTRKETGLVPKTSGPRKFSKKTPTKPKVEAYKHSILRLIPACQFRKEKKCLEKCLSIANS